jgi:hypothetical protein
MSLLNLLHKNVIIKFADSTKSAFNPEASYVFRLTGVDAMGFLHIQNLKPGTDAEHEAAAEPYWINKDLIREMHELNLTNGKGTLYYNGQATKPQAAKPEPKPQIDQVRRDLPPKLNKVKTSAKQKSALN